MMRRLCYAVIMYALLLIFVCVANFGSCSQEANLLSDILSDEADNMKGYLLFQGSKNVTDLRFDLNEELAYPTISSNSMKRLEDAFQNKFVLIFELHFYSIKSPIITKLMNRITISRKLRRNLNSYIYLIPSNWLGLFQTAIRNPRYMTHIIVSDDPKPKVATVCPGHNIVQAPTRTTCSNPLIGKHLRVAVFGSPPYVLRTTTPWIGSDIDLMHLVAKKIGFTFELTPGKWWSDAAEAVGLYIVQC